MGDVAFSDTLSTFTILYHFFGGYLEGQTVEIRDNLCFAKKKKQTRPDPASAESMLGPDATHGQCTKWVEGRAETMALKPCKFKGVFSEPLLGFTVHLGYSKPNSSELFDTMLKRSIS